MDGIALQRRYQMEVGGIVEWSNMQFKLKIKFKLHPQIYQVKPIEDQDQALVYLV